MEGQNQQQNEVVPAVEQSQSVVSAPEPVNSQQQMPKNNNFLVVLLSILLLLSTSVAGFFAYQTQKLVKELSSNSAQMANDQIAEPTTTPEISPMVEQAEFPEQSTLPSSSPSATPIESPSPSSSPTSAMQY